MTVQNRPDTMSGFTECISTGAGKLYVTVNSLDGKPFEVFAQIGKSGWTTMADTEAICRLISLALRGGILIEDIIQQLANIGGDVPVYQDNVLVKSIPDAISKVLQRHFPACSQ